MTLKAKTSLLLAALVLAAVTLTGAVATHIMEGALRQAVGGGLAGVAQSATDAIHGYLARSLADARLIASQVPKEALRDGDAAALDLFLADHAALSVEFHNGMFLLGPGGELLSDHPPHPETRGRSFAHRAYFRETLRLGRGVVGQPYRSARTGAPVVTFTAPIRDDDGILLGVLGCSAHLLQPSALGGLRRIQVGGSGYLYLYDTSRLMILHPDLPRILTRDVPPGANRLFDAAIDERFEGMGETVNSRGAPMLLHLNRIEGVDWILGVQQPREEALAPLRRVRRSLWATAACAGVFSVVIGVVAVGRITAPLRRLRQAAQQLGRDTAAGAEPEGSGPGEVEAPPAGDEIGALGQAFQEMAESLRRSLGSLRGSLREWQQTFDAVPAVVFICDPHGNVLRANRAAGELRGEEPQALLGRRLDEIVGGADGESVWSRCREALTDRRPVRLDCTRTEDDRLFHAQAIPLQEDGGPGDEVRLLFVAQDMTQQRRFEAALIRTRQRFQELVELLPEMVFEADAGGRLRFANRQALQLTGYSAAELCGGMHVADLVEPRDREAARQEWSRLAAGAGDGGGGEYRFLRKDGSEFSGLLRLAPMAREADADAGHVRGLIIDVTERRHMESQLRQAGKLEAIGQLAGGIAHDFNNLLTPIVGYTEMVLEDVDGEAREMLDQVLTSAMRARDLVEQLLTFSRRDEDEGQATPTTPVLQEAVRFLRATLPASIELRSNFATEGACTRAEPTQLQQIVVNLGSNAAQALGSSPGHINVTATRQEFSGAEAPPPAELAPGPYVVIEVQDSGPGIDPSLADRIFDPFFTTREVGEGSGLGLSVVHGIVTRLGGAALVRSEPGRGTRVSVYLPRVDEKTGEAAVLAADGESGAGVRILLVEDEVLVAEFVRKALERHGYEVVANRSSVDALELFRSNPKGFDLVITDQTMPEMTGITLAREVLRVSPETPILLCTGYSRTVTPETAAREGLRGYLMKPVSVAELLRAVQRALPRG